MKALAKAPEVLLRSYMEGSFYPFAAYRRFVSAARPFLGRLSVAKYPAESFWPSTYFDGHEARSVAEARAANGGRLAHPVVYWPEWPLEFDRLSAALSRQTHRAFVLCCVFYFSFLSFAASAACCRLCLFSAIVTFVIFSSIGSCCCCLSCDSFLLLLLLLLLLLMNPDCPNARDATGWFIVKVHDDGMLFDDHTLKPEPYKRRVAQSTIAATTWFARETPSFCDLAAAKRLSCLDSDPRRFTRRKFAETKETCSLPCIHGGNYLGHTSHFL